MILVGCKADLLLAKFLAAGRVVKHCDGKGPLCERLEKGQGLIGLVDEDPGVGWPRYLRELARPARGAEKCHNTQSFAMRRGDKIVMLCPRLEEWILEACERQKLASRHSVLAESLNGFTSSFGKSLVSSKSS